MPLITAKSRTDCKFASGFRDKMPTAIRRIKEIEILDMCIAAGVGKGNSDLIGLTLRGICTATINLNRFISVAIALIGTVVV